MKQFFIFIATFIFVTHSFSQDIVTDLEADYSFTGNANDASGNGYHGSVNGAVLTTDRFGNTNSAYDFTSGDTYIDFGEVLDNVFVGPDNQFSISAWVKPAGDMTNNVIVAKNADFACSENQRQFFFRIFGPNHNLSFSYYSSLTTGNVRRVIGSTSIDDPNKWYHVAVTYDGSIDANDGLDRVKLYVDCVEETTQFETNNGFVTDIQDGTAHLGIGNYVDPSGSSCDPALSFNGKIDDVKIYDGIICSYELNTICSNTTPISESQIFIEIPNLITPNNDKLNDALVINSEIKNGWEIEIFNRWGKSIYKNENYKNNWEAINNQDGLYFYVIKNQIIDQVITGYILVVR